MSKKKKILVILGGSSREREISLESGKSCIKVLKQLGYKVLKFDPNLGYRVPHMGWDNIKVSETCTLFEDIKNDDDFYFVHSYHADCDPKFVIAECQYGISITAEIEKENVIGFQFHP